MAQAEAAARSLGHEIITDQHLLLGLLGVEDGLAARILTNLGVTADAARRAVLAETPEGSLPVDGPMPIDPTLKRHMFETARGKAADLGHNFVGTEHLLLALVEESQTIRDILASVGMDPADVRPALIELLHGQRKDK